MDLLLADQVPDGRGGDHDLERHDATPAVGGRDQLLREHAFEHERQLRPHLGLLGGREDVDDAVDGLGAGVGVQGAERQVARFGDGEGGGDRLEIPHLAHQHHVRVLAEDVLEGVLERLGVREDLTLVHQAFLVVVDELDRVLDRHDVLGALGVDLVHHGRERCRLARAGRPGHEDQPLGPVGELLDHRGESELVERPDLDGDDPDRGRDRAALTIDVAAEPCQALDAERQVELVVLLELLLLPLVQDAVGKPLSVLGRQPLKLGQRRQLAVQPYLWGGARRNVQIGRPPFDHDRQQVVHRRSHSLGVLLC